MKRFLIAVTTVFSAAATVLVLLPGAMPAYAQEINPCTKDFKEICSDVTPGSGRLVRCYEERKDKMSAACKGWAETAKANSSVLAAACSKELEARCNSERGDPFGTLDCLQSNYIDLSMECRVRLNEFKGRYPKPVQ